MKILDRTLSDVMLNFGWSHDELRMKSSLTWETHKSCPTCINKLSWTLWKNSPKPVSPLAVCPQPPVSYTWDHVMKTDARLFSWHRAKEACDLVLPWPKNNVGTVVVSLTCQNNFLVFLSSDFKILLQPLNYHQFGLRNQNLLTK
jgi:hypothetical protein